MDSTETWRMKPLLNKHHYHHTAAETLPRSQVFVGIFTVWKWTLKAAGGHGNGHLVGMNTLLAYTSSPLLSRAGILGSNIPDFQKIRDGYARTGCEGGSFGIVDLGRDERSRHPGGARA